MGDELMQTMQEVDATPRLIVEILTSTLAGRRFAFTATDLKHGVLLGRASDCHVRFDAGKDLKVSGHHALIDDKDGKVTVRDQGSSNGVFLNDVRVTPSGAAVISGSKLSLGQEGAIMKLLVPGQPSTGATPSKAPAASAAPVAAQAPAAASAAPAKPSPSASAAAPQPAAATASPAPAAQKISPPSQGEPPPMRGMPSVQTDPAIREKMMAQGAGTTQPEARELQAPRKKGGIMGTLIGALFFLILAAAAMGAWHMKWLDSIIK